MSKEIEAKFINIDKEAVIKKLQDLGASLFLMKLLKIIKISQSWLLALLLLLKED